MTKILYAVPSHSPLDTALTVHMLVGVREWSFAADTHNADGDGRGLSVTEYIAIGVCSILLGLIYVASVFLYLHVRRRRRGDKHRDRRNGQPVHLSGADEGVVKSNPLLATKRHPLEAGSYLSDSGSCCSDSDAVSDVVPMSDDNNRIAQNVSTHFFMGLSVFTVDILTATVV